MYGDDEQPEVYFERAARAMLDDLCVPPSASEIMPFNDGGDFFGSMLSQRIAFIQSLPLENQREIQRRAVARFAERHPEKVRQWAKSRNQRRYERDPERYKAESRAYYQRIRERRCEMARAKYAAMSDEERAVLRAKQRAYYRKRRENS